MSDIAIIIPMLGRPHTIEPLLGSIRDTCDAHVVFACSPGDYEVLDLVAEEHYVVVDGPSCGDYAKKINAGYRATSEPLIFTGACDIKFHPGWLEAATEKLTEGIGVVGTNDMGSLRVMAGLHSTHSLVTRDYVERFGTIDCPGLVLHEGYPHEYVDDELVQTAMYRSAWAFAVDSHVEHLHPVWGKAPTDAMYEQMNARMEAGWGLYLQRQRLWGG
jgi:glycosyltransferase involved in cell wall biosynthesis